MILHRLELGQLRSMHACMHAQATVLELGQNKRMKR